MNKLNIIIVLLFSCVMTQSQIVIDNVASYNTPVFLIDNVLLGDDDRMLELSGTVNIIY